MTWFLTVISDRWHALNGLPWAGYVASMCGRSFHLEDIEEDCEHVDPVVACPKCRRAVKKAAKK